ncbi:hypothetical protein L6164_029464 [Bauhinia variegata]|uniref:Uncharacterized protein n=1 Tax=Bauhinia variegata TaxID=167791 RepID=A0ACB9LAP3_BAUVA|nr:hypothetical protein L6164_029464 [Bauhinia variegata]
MDGEIQRFIKLWVTAISCLCYCYYVSARMPKGLLRLLSILPIIYLFIILPFNLSSFHLGAPTIFFLSWLSTFKLLLFSFNRGPLSPSPTTIFHFISIAALPIKLKQDQPPSKSPTRNTNPDIVQSPQHELFNGKNTRPSNQTLNPEKSEPHDNDSSTFVKSILVGIKLLLLAMIICAYDHRENLHPHFILALYCCHLYLALEIVLGLGAISARSIFGFELEPQFNEPYLSTSLQDFWGRRWNLMVTNILRPAVYHPSRRLFTPLLGPKWGQPPATVATFVVSGLMHEFIFYYFARAPPTWEVTWFFVLHGVCTAVEVAAKKAAVHRGWRLNRLVSRMLTIAFLVVTGEWLFFPEIIRNGVDRRAIGEYAILVDFVKSKLQLQLNITNK